MPNDDKTDQLLEIPDFLKRKKDDNSESPSSVAALSGHTHVVSSSSEGIPTVLPGVGLDGNHERLGRRRKRKSSRDVRTLKRLGWTASQLNKIDHRQASEYAYTEKAPPKLYERKKDDVK